MSILKKLIITAVLGAVLVGCSLSTDDLAAEVQANMAETLAEENIKITSFNLSHKGGNEYKGILKTREPHGEFVYSVEVIYDGKMFTWEIEG